MRTGRHGSEPAECTADVGAPLQREHFESARTTQGIRASCALNSVVTDCSDFLSIVDDEWALVADWYRIDGRERPPELSVEVMYGDVGRRDLQLEPESLRRVREAGAVARTVRKGSRQTFGDLDSANYNLAAEVAGVRLAHAHPTIWGRHVHPP